MKVNRVISLSVLAALFSAVCQGQVFIAQNGEASIAPIPIPIHQMGVRLSGLHVTTDIHDQTATTTLEQEFFNSTPRRVEGEYLFPIPLDAHLDKFELMIDGEMKPAEMLNAQQAQKIYEDIVRRTKDPALMQYMGQGLLRLRVFPIDGNAKRTIKLTYTHLLKKDSGLISYQCPVQYEMLDKYPIENLSLDVKIHSSKAIKAVYSPSHDIHVVHAGTGVATVGYEATNFTGSGSFQLFYQPESKNDIGLEVITFSQGSEGYFMLLASPGYVDEGKSPVSRDVVFVMDTSGSMSGEKIEQARGTLKYCVNRLNEGDRFEVVRFSTTVEPLFGGLVELNKENRDKAIGFADSFVATGSTALEQALLTSLDPFIKAGSAERPAVVIFLTDGLPTVGTRDDDTIMKNVGKKLTEVGNQPRVFCFGVGDDVNAFLLDSIAENTKAIGQYVLPGEDIEAKVSTFYSKIAHPVLTDITLAFDDEAKVSDMHPQVLPNLFKGDQMVVLGKYHGPGIKSVKLTGKSRDKVHEYSYRVSAENNGSHANHEFVAQLWANRRVGYLLDQIRMHGENKESVDEIRKLAKEFGIVTPYTAYLIVEDNEALPAEARFMRIEDKDMAQAKVEMEMLREQQEGYSSLRVGRAAVRNAAANKTLQAGDTVDSLHVAGDQARSSFGGSGQTGSRATPGSVFYDAEPAAMTYDNSISSRATRYVRGRAFFNNANLWIDSSIADRPDAKRVKILFGSDEYFELMKKHPDMPSWLSVAQNVNILLDDTVYEVTMEESKQ